MGHHMLVDTDGLTWQADMGDGKWSDVDPLWPRHLFEAIRSGEEELRLPHDWVRNSGKQMRDWYTIDLRDHGNITQRNEGSGTVRRLRPIRALALRAAPSPDTESALSEWELPAVAAPSPDTQAALSPDTPAALAPSPPDTQAAPSPTDDVGTEQPPEPPKEELQWQNED